jgi:stearoyl-CoA desaturase (delta-9 desaturase)
MAESTSHYGGALLFVGVHLMGLFIVQTGIRWEWILLAVVSYYLRMFAVTAGYHRYFSHRSFKTSRTVQFMLAFLAMTSAQKGVLWWAAHHRHHHKFSDQKQDFHSPLQRGFWFSHVGWILSQESRGADVSLVKDLARYPELSFLNRFYFLPPLLYGLLIYFVWGFPGLIWGFLCRRRCSITVPSSSIPSAIWSVAPDTHLETAARIVSRWRSCVVEKAGTTITIITSQPSIKAGSGGKSM